MIKVGPKNINKYFIVNYLLNHFYFQRIKFLALSSVFARLSANNQLSAPLEQVPPKKQTYEKLVCTVLIMNIQGIASVPDSLAGKVWILLIYLNCEVPCCLKLH